MELVYKRNEITGKDEVVEVIIERVPVLNTKLTQTEKLAFFGGATPDQIVWQNISWLEVDAKNQDGTPKTTLNDTVKSMVTQGLITQDRADKILS